MLPGSVLGQARDGVDRVKFARVIGGWLMVGAGIVWLSGPLATIVLPRQTACGPTSIPCGALAAMVQHAIATLFVALFAFVLLRLCYRRIADAGLKPVWHLAGVLPLWFCCQEITTGALSCDELKLLIDSWPDYTLKTPRSLLFALIATAIIGLIPSARAKRLPATTESDPAHAFANRPASLSARP